MISEDAKRPMISVMAKIGTPKKEHRFPRTEMRDWDFRQCRHCPLQIWVDFSPYTTYLKQQVKDSTQEHHTRL